MSYPLVTNVLAFRGGLIGSSATQVDATADVEGERSRDELDVRASKMRKRKGTGVGSAHQKKFKPQDTEEGS